MSLPRSTHNKPWFDIDCKKAKNDIKISLLNCKIYHFNDSSIQILLNKKNWYKKLKNKSKENYHNQITIHVATVNNPANFWNTIHRIKSN